MIGALKIFVVSLLSLLAISAQANMATTASVYLKGEPGSWVSGAVGAPEATWTHGIDGLFGANTNFEKGVSITYHGDAYWSFEFAAPTYNPETMTNDGQALTATFYDHATRYPFNSPTRPGINISGNGRGNNVQSGWFRVLEIEYGTGGDISKFAVDFRQYDENMTMSGPSLYGSLRFNSSIPITPVPEPSMALLLLAGVAVVARTAGRRNRRSLSTH